MPYIRMELVPLKTQIYTFVSTFKTMPTDIIRAYFREFSDADINWSLKMLKSEGRLYQTESNTITSIDKGSSLNPPDIKLVKALWVLASFGSSSVSYFHKLPQPGEYPKQILFIAENSLYEVSTILEASKNLDKSLLFRNNKSNEESINSGEESINICIVDTVETGKEMFDFNFDAYCMLDENNTPSFFQE